MLTEEVWGKTLLNSKGESVYYPLMAHLLDSATVAGVLWGHWLRPEIKSLFPDDFKKYIQFAAGIHDIGKCSPYFQGSLLNSRATEQHRGQREKLEHKGFFFPEDLNVGNLRSEKIHRHEKLGIYSLLGGPYDNELASGRWLEIATLGHHGSFLLNFVQGRRGARSASEEALEESISGEWLEEIERIVASLEEAVGVSREGCKEIALDPEAIILLSGLVILSDRLASSMASVENGYESIESGAISINRSKDWLIFREDFLHEIAKRNLGFSVKLSESDVMGSFSRRGLQKVVPERGGLWIAMAPTGSGKTESALLRQSQHQENLIFLLPTMATTNAMMGRVQKTFADKPQTTAVLGHGLAFLEDFYKKKPSSEIEEDFEDCGLYPTEFSGVKGAKLSASINVATIDQMIMGALPVKWTHLRLLLLANSHIVIDEAHLIDHYQVELLRPLLFFLGKTQTRVSILSATLPTWLEHKISSAYSDGQIETNYRSQFPSSVVVHKSGDSGFERISETEIEVENYISSLTTIRSAESEDAHISWAKRVLEKEPMARVGIFVNQIKRAQDIALQLEKEIPDAKVLCLHSRMLAGHRKKVTDELIKICGTQGGEAERVILVGTQVIEMSLDIDLDFVSTDVCPAPNLIQRMGRAWRDKSSAKRFERISDEHNNMSTHVVVPVRSDNTLDKGKVLPYGEAVTLRTIDFLEGRDKLVFPDDLQEFVETSVLEGEVKNKAEMSEKADEFYRTLRGADVAINIKDELYDFPPEISDFGFLTNNEGMNEELATRLIENNTEPFVVRSESRMVQELGAIPIKTSLDEINFRRAQLASVSVSYAMAKRLRESGCDDLYLTDSGGKTSKWAFGLHGEIPSSFEYSELVGLREKA